jgi:mannosyl-oligosaccharide glucosidase
MITGNIAPEDLKTMVVFYVGLEGFGSLNLANEPDEKGLEGTVTLEGSLAKLGDFKIDITTGPKTNKAPPATNKRLWAEKPLDRTLYHSFQVADDEVWKAKGGQLILAFVRDWFLIIVSIQMLCL